METLPSPNLSLRYRFWCWRKYLKEAEIRFCARMAKGRCIDVGANAGAYTYFMQRAGCQVECFEPIPELANALRRRYGHLVSVHQCAASNREGPVDIHVPLEGAQPLYGYASATKRWDKQLTISATARTLDSFTFDGIGLIKIDVEGHELAVLQGAAETIRASMPVLIVEAEEKHRIGALESVRAFLEALGYKGCFLDVRKLRPLSELGDAANVFNFIFVPKM